jgi:hypothetical protein
MSSKSVKFLLRISLISLYSIMAVSHFIEVCSNPARSPILLRDKDLFVFSQKLAFKHTELRFTMMSQTKQFNHHF